MTNAETATMRDELLANIPDAGTRKTVAALTDLQQTHLTHQDARDWGGSRD